MGFESFEKPPTPPAEEGEGEKTEEEIEEEKVEQVEESEKETEEAKPEEAPETEEGAEKVEESEEMEEKLPEEEKLEGKISEEKKPEGRIEKEPEEAKDKLRYSADMWLRELREGLNVKGVDVEGLKEIIKDKPNCEDLEGKLMELNAAYEENSENVRHFQERVDELASILNKMMEDFSSGEIPDELITTITAKKEELNLIKTGLVYEQGDIERQHGEWVEEAMRRPTRKQFEERKEIEEMRKREEEEKRNKKEEEEREKEKKKEVYKKEIGEI